MTLDEAIKHCKEVAIEYEAKGECYECAKDYRQLAELLEDYKELKADYIELDNLIRKANTENDELKRLLKLAVDDFETAMLEEKCKVCGLEHCDYDEICKWRHHDEAMKLLVAERMPLPEPPRGDAE